jgi:hypothetical protein
MTAMKIGAATTPQVSRPAVSVRVVAWAVVVDMVPPWSTG